MVLALIIRFGSGVRKAAQILVQVAKVLWQLLIELIAMLLRLILWVASRIIELLNWLAPLIYANYIKRHRSRLRNNENILRLFLAIFLLFIISRALLASDWRLGIFFIIAGTVAIWFGYIYRNRDVILLVLIGVVIGTIVTILAPDAWKAFKAGDYIGAAVIIGIMAYFYLKSRGLKKGKRPRL